MIRVTSTSQLPGMAVQQKYGHTELTANRTNPRLRTTVISSGDTVQISSEAWELFRTQTTVNATGVLPLKDTDHNQMAGRKGVASPTFRTAGSGTSARDQVGQLKTEISGLESEIAALEKRAETDEHAAAILRNKQAQLQALQAKLMGLIAKFYQIS